MVAETFKGTRDIYADDMRFRQYVIARIRNVFTVFGFEELETPAIERESTLQGKYGDEGEKLIFRLRELHEGGLRYDHTVPLARFMAANSSSLVLPYRRFAIGPVFRAEKPQRGRFRQFTQCDYDTVGNSSPLIDAEIVAINHMTLSRLGFTDQYSVHVNDRRLLNALVTEMGYTDPAVVNAVFRTWDKLDKISTDQAFEYLLEEVVHSSAQSLATVRNDLTRNYKSVTDFLLGLQGQPAQAVLTQLSKRFQSPITKAAIANLATLIEYVAVMDVPAGCYEVNPLLARGLSYYTGPIFETVIKTANIGSVTGGGRYDNLIEAMGGPSLPASGSSFGLERLLSVMETLGLRPDFQQSASVFVTVFDAADQTVTRQTLKLASLLRENNLATEIYTGTSGKLKSQLQIANRKNVPLVLILGPDEAAKGVVTVKDLRPSGIQRTVPLAVLVTTIQALLQEKSL